MNSIPLDTWVVIMIGITVPVAMFTDLSTRRIPNSLTFPLLAAAITVRALIQGMPGIALALAGAILAPLVLVLLHGGRGPGMGDLKLAAGLGAALGPFTAVLSMLAAALIGGLMAMVWMLRPGGLYADLLVMCIPFLSRFWKGAPKAESDSLDKSHPTLPYGVAIGLGAVLIMAVRSWTGHNVWFL